MAYGDGDTDATSGNPELNGVGDIDADADDGEGGDTDTASTELPAFLTEDEPAAVALNGASAP